MTSRLVSALDLSIQDQEDIANTIGPVKSVAEFLKDAVQALKDTDFLTRLGEATRWWLHMVGAAAAEATSPVKFVAALIDRLGTIRDPDQLGYLACTTAFQRSIEKALRHVGPPVQRTTLAGWTPSSTSTESEDLKFASFSLILQHPR